MFRQTPNLVQHSRFPVDYVALPLCCDIWIDEAFSLGFYTISNCEQINSGFRYMPNGYNLAECEKRFKRKTSVYGFALCVFAERFPWNWNEFLKCMRTSEIRMQMYSFRESKTQSLQLVQLFFVNKTCIECFQKKFQPTIVSSFNTFWCQTSSERDYQEKTISA